MSFHYPRPLQPGSTIAVTAFSSGVEAKLLPRLDQVLADLRARGFNVLEGQCLRHEVKSASAPAHERAQELMAFLLDDAIDAIAPPWGGELAMEVLALLDFTALAHVRPKWILGFSDVSTIAAALCAKLGWATGHCHNLMDLVLADQHPLIANTLACYGTELGGRIFQRGSQQFSFQWPDIANNANAVFQGDTDTQWHWLVPAEGHQVSGRLIGGCWDVLHHLLATSYLDLQQFKARTQEPVLLYLENVEMSPQDLTRAILAMKFRGVFAQVDALLLGRNMAKEKTGEDELRYADVYQAHLSNLGVPVLMDMDIGHVPPNLALVNGAKATVFAHGREMWIEQTLC